MLSPVFDTFVEASPISVMMRGLMEHIFNSERMNQIFNTYSKRQYEQDLLFSTVVDLMSLVVCGMYPSVHAAYQKKAASVNVSSTALYNKQQRVELSVSRALLQQTTSDLQQLIKTLGVEYSSPLGKNYLIRIVDGSCLAGTERRLAALRSHAAKPLPGKTIAILDPQTKLVVDVIPCEDGHAQERSLFNQILAQVQPQQVWIADRNFCTAGFLHTIAQQGAFFVIRQHGGLGYKPISELQAVGLCQTGTVFEQQVEIVHEGVALSAYNLLATLKAVLGSVHGVDKIAAGLSDFYLVDDIRAIYRGMMIAIPPIHWQCFEDFTLNQMVDVLQHLAPKVHLKSFRKHPRASKKKRPPLTVDGKHPHCSTARKLKEYQAAQDVIP